MPRVPHSCAVSSRMSGVRSRNPSGPLFLQQRRRSRIVTKMATAPNPALPPETRQLTAEEGWDLIFSLFGTAKDLYAEYGGGEAWLKAERAAWADEPDR